MTHFTTPIVAALLLLTTPAFAQDADVEAAIASWQDAFNAGDGKAAADLIFAEDAMLLPPNGPMVEGRDAIATFWQGAIDSGFHSLALKPLSIEVLGDTAIETGTWAGVMPGADGAADTELTGKTLVIWKKGDDGAWRMTQDMWNDN